MKGKRSEGLILFSLNFRVAGALTQYAYSGQLCNPKFRKITNFLQKTPEFASLQNKLAGSRAKAFIQMSNYLDI
jgi:hypothetical protein